MRNRILTLCLLVALSMGSNQAFGATAKAGGACTKVGQKSGFLVCTKISGKLKWKIVKRAQTIKYSAPKQASVVHKSINFTFSSTSGLAVSATTLTSNVCTVGKSVILLLGSPGLCRISLMQRGNIYYQPAKPILLAFTVYGTNVIDFRLPGALLLSQGTYQLSAVSSSHLPVTFSSTTDSVCTIAGSILTLIQVGTCTLVATQSGVGLIPQAISVSRNLEIVTGRELADFPDTITGFQIKPVYVVPSDGVDNLSDVNGYLAGILDEGNNYLSGQINQTVPIDRTAKGYDIQYLKSQYSTEYLRTHESAKDPSASDAAVLMTEIKAMENPGENRKDYIFFLEVPGFDAQYCGLAATPGMIAVVALENVSDTQTCRGASAAPFDNYTSKTWIHELIHNFGVEHTPNDSCDLMYGGGAAGPCASPDGITVDKSRSLYVGTSSSQGPDILGLRVWSGKTNDQSLKANCLTAPVARTDGVAYAYCPTGTRNIGSLTGCWQSVNSVSLEELVDGAWVSLGAGSYFTKFWDGDLPQIFCFDPNSSLSVYKQVTVEAPGIHHYRWVANDRIFGEMNIIWVR